MSLQSAKRRGARTQDVVRNWFRSHGHPHAEDAPASISGRDILGVLGWAPEVKARRDFSPLAWLRQAKRNAGEDRHCVVFRCDGQGEETVADWGVIVRLEDFTDLLTMAGYGDPRSAYQHTPFDAQLRGLHMARTPCEHCRINVEIAEGIRP